jgi:hypothetical protein
VCGRGKLEWGGVRVGKKRRRRARVVSMRVRRFSGCAGSLPGGPSRWTADPACLDHWAS